MTEPKDGCVAPARGPLLQPEPQSSTREKLFTTFFFTKGTSGTGLGLVVTQKIVQEHGGSIEVETEHKRGSLFRIPLPQEEPSPPSAEQTRAGT
jgi:K+-sensing histidine kinase KdpD